MIPVLPGLSRDEIRSILPKLIAQSPELIKTAMARMLKPMPGTGAVTSPLSPAEYLVQLHALDRELLKNVDPKQSAESNKLYTTRVKHILDATNLCFRDRQLYKQEVLAVVLQQLIDQTPLPRLFMRTLIQTLVVCPALNSFIMGILSRLLGKRVWEDSTLWDGFIKCAQMTKPHSLPVLMQLPRAQLALLLLKAPEFKQSLRAYAMENPSAAARALLPLLGLAKESETSGAGSAGSLLGLQHQPLQSFAGGAAPPLYPQPLQTLQSQPRMAFRLQPPLRSVVRPTGSAPINVLQLVGLQPPTPSPYAQPVQTIGSSGDSIVLAGGAPPPQRPVVVMQQRLMQAPPPQPMKQPISMSAAAHSLFSSIGQPPPTATTLMVKQPPPQPLQPQLIATEPPPAPAKSTNQYNPSAFASSR